MTDRYELQRLRYWRGQKLRGVDFRDEAAIASQMWWWHNRALHNAFGIAEGFAVEMRDFEYVIVNPGVGFDSFGRELILRNKLGIVLPKRETIDPGGVTLLAYFEDTDRTCQETDRYVLCDGTAPGSGHTRFRWKPTARVGVQDGLPLARVGYDTLNERFALSTLRYASRRLSRPHIATGKTLAGNGWAPWRTKTGPVESGEKGERVLGLQIRVDTRVAGFKEIPCYFAWVSGSGDARPEADLEADREANIEASLIEVPTNVDDATAEGFTLRLEVSDAAKRGAYGSIEQQKLSVFWLGIEPNSQEARENRPMI